MKAVTIRVNDVEGVAGFVLPGDHVDIVLTRQTDKDVGTNDVVVQNARVLAVDQLADARAEKPTVAKQ
jgi:pilus assembly protein CpaB